MIFIKIYVKLVVGLQKQKMKIKSKKTLLLSLAIALVLIAGGVYAYSRNQDSKVPDTPTPAEKINYKPPTKQEEKAGDKAKEKFDTNPSSGTNNNDSTKSVKPEITYYDVYKENVEVSSHVPGVLEKTGKCTLKLKKSGKTVSQSKTAVPNVSEMSCGLIKISVSKLSAGTWTATVVYSSVKVKGSSDAVFIEVK